MITLELTSIQLPMFLAAVFIISIIFLGSLKNKEAFKTILALTALFAIAWVPDIWNDPLTLMGYEFVVFMFMWWGLRTPPGRVMAVLVIFMILDNGYFVFSEGYPLYRKSIVSSLFFLQCVFSIGTSCYTHYLRGEKKDKSYGSVYMLEESEVKVS